MHYHESNDQSRITQYSDVYEKGVQKVMDEDKHAVIFDSEGQITKFMSLTILLFCTGSQLLYWNAKFDSP